MTSQLTLQQSWGIKTLRSFLDGSYVLGGDRRQHVADGNISDLDADADILYIQDEINKTNNKEKLNETLGSLGILPIRTHGIAKSTKIKITQLELERSIEAQNDIAAGALDVSKEELSFREEAPIDPDIMRKEKDLDRLLCISWRRNLMTESWRRVERFRFSPWPQRAGESRK